MAGKPQTLSKGQEDHVVEILRKKLLYWVITGFTILAGLTGASLLGIMQRVQSRVEALIAQQFEKPQIQEVVRDVAAERSSALMTQQISPEVVRFKAEIAGQLEDLHALVARTQELESRSRQHEQAIQGVLQSLKDGLERVDTQLIETQQAGKRLEDIGGFMLLTIKALGDDAIAWDTLVDISKNSTNQFMAEARDISAAIQNRFVGPELPAWTIIPDAIEKQLRPLSAEQLKAVMPILPSMLHTHLVYTVWNSTNFSKYAKLDFMAFVIDKSGSLTARATAGKHFAEESGGYYGSLHKNISLQWWITNSSRIAAADSGTK